MAAIPFGGYRQQDVSSFSPHTKIAFNISVSLVVMHFIDGQTKRKYGLKIRSMSIACYNAVIATSSASQSTLTPSCDIDGNMSYTRYTASPPPTHPYFL